MTASTAGPQPPPPAAAGRTAPRMATVAGLGALLAFVIGAIALAGWALGAPMLAQFYASGSAMQPFTAVSAILGAAVAALVSRDDRHAALARVVAAIVLCIALQALAEHWSGSDFGTDHLLFPAAVGRQPGHYDHPGRMAEPTAVAFVLVAAALFLLRIGGRVAGLLVSGCATAVLLLVTVALLSHMYVVRPMTGALGFTQVAVPTALALGGLSIAALALRPGGGWVSRLTGNSVGATAARWLLPIVTAVPVLVGFAALHGSAEGLYPADFRMAFTTAVTVILLAALALWGTKQLDWLVAERRMSETLRESEATLRAFFDTEGLLASIVERRGARTRYLTTNVALARLFGRDDLAGLNVGEVGPAAVRRALLDSVASVERLRQPLRMEQSIETPTGIRWFMMTVSPILDSPRDRPRFAIASLDITERKRAEERQRLLLDELNHRVKNTLAVVQSLALQSFRGDQATPAARQAFEERLSAVAAAHHLLVRQEWTSVSLRHLVADVAGPGCGADRNRVDADGPDVLLPPPVAVSLALALHELCTNAVKYGALSNDTGRVAIHWVMDRDDPAIVRIDWREHGGPPVAVPATRGFGSRLIERALSTELGFPVQLRFDPDGLRCTIVARLPAPASVVAQ